MKTFIQGRTGSILIGVVLGLLVAVLAWRFGGSNWWEVRGAIADLTRGGKDVAKARTRLEALNDRGYVLEKLEAAVADDSYTVRAKFDLLTTLNMLSQPRAIRRALDSPSVTAQRAACWLLHGDPEAKARCTEIVLAWLRDAGDAERSIAAMIANQLRLEEAQPALLEIVGRDPKTPDELRLFRQALFALKDPKPPDLIERLLAMAGNAALDTEARGIALEALQRVKDGPRDRILELAAGILTDSATDRILRIRAASALREFPEDRAWQALEGVLLSEKETDHVLQRNCLFSLGQMSPSDKAVADRYLDRLTQLLLDRRVYHSPYFATKVDVAITLCALNVREPIVIDIMCDYLVDEDREDKQRLVRQEAWLTLWTLTGERLDDVPSPELFQIPPQPFADRKDAREFFFSRRRPGITPKQNAAIEEAAKNLAWMQKARQVYQSGKARIVERWRAEAEAKKADKPN